MLKQYSIRSKLVIIIIIGCLVPFIFGSVFIKNRAQEWSDSYALEKANFILQQTAQRVDESVLMNMENLVELITLDERIIAVDSTINSFVDYDQSVFISSTSKTQQSLMTFFEGVLKTHSIIEIVSFGTEEGGYVEYPEFKPNSPYDPRIRPWYINAKKESSNVISEPYMTQESKQLVISIDQKVMKDNEFIGVISLTIGLNELMDNINKIPYGKTGYINVLSPSNVFISSPQHKDWLMKTIFDIDSAEFQQVDFYNNKSYEATIDGIEKVINVFISPYSGWKYISVVDKSEIYQESKQLSDLLWIIILVIMITVFSLIIIIANYIAKPILNIANIIGKMATFDFDVFENNQEDLNSNSKDEIGVISRALYTMQRNFLELKQFMKEIDHTIENVEINEKEVHQVGFSEDSPFKSMERSLNGLLHKMHVSLNKVQLTNKQLVASEEELIAQVEEIETQRKYISFLAEHDPLTNLPNRRKFNEILKSELDKNIHGAILLLDLDNFKAINDTIGHLFGDKVLSVMSNKLIGMESENIFMSRFGGDEFLILFKNYDSQENLDSFISKLYQEFTTPISIDKHEVKIEFSIGVSLFPEDSVDINQLIMNADLALYSAKNSGKKNFAYYSYHLSDVLKRKLDIKSVLIDAIDSDGFKVVYQPQVDIKTGEITGYEALLRLKNHAMSPGEFIEVAEEYGQIIVIGRIVTEKVIEQLNTWKNQGLKLKPVAINFSAHQMLDNSYEKFLFNLLDKNNMAPELICIEITESIFLENRKDAIDFLTRLRAKGVKIAVDDFGTGYSSLSYLTFLPIDTLKLDRQLCVKFLELENIKVMDSLIALSHSLGFKVIAEGIEEMDQVKRLIVGKCDMIQGYYFSRPLDPADVVKQHDVTYVIFPKKL